MKKIIIALAALFFITLNLDAQEMPLISATHFKNIHIGNDLEVVLINAPSQQQDLQFNSVISSKLDISIEGGTLLVSNRAFSKKGTVYLLVNGLEKLVIGQNSNIITHGVLQSQNLHVFVSQGASARIKLLGKVKAFSADDSEVRIEKLAGTPVVKTF